MENFLEKNLELLTKHHTYLRDKAVESLKEDYSEKNTLSVEARNGQPALRYNLGESTVTLHSTYDPQAETERFVDSIKNTVIEKDTMVVFGMGAGYLAERLIDLYPGRNKVIFEYSSDIFAEAIKVRDFTKVLTAQNVAIYVGLDEEEISSVLKSLFFGKLIFNVCFLEMPSYKRLFGNTIEKVKKDFVDYYKTYTVNIRTLKVFNQIWIYNCLSNLRHIGNSSNTNGFVGKFRDIPAVIVGSGPSLKKNVHLLGDLKDSALLISAGSSIGVLQKNCIVPHLNVSIDGGPPMSADINNIEKQEDIMLGYVNNIHFDCIDRYKGPKFYIKSPAESTIDAFEEMAGIKTPQVGFGGSCVSTALDLAFNLGCNPIILVGVDLAYTDRKTHADGILQRADIQEIKEDNISFIRMKDIYGEDTFTGSNLLSMLMALNDYMERKTGECTFVNATEGGLPMEHAGHMPLAEAMDKYCCGSRGISGLLKECYDSGILENRLNEEKLLDFYNGLNKDAKELFKLSSRRLKLVRDVLKRLERGSLDDLAETRRKIEKLTKKIEESKLYKIHIHYLVKDLIDAVKSNTENRAASGKTTVEKLKVLYQGIKKQYESIEEKIVIFMKVSEEVRDKYQMERGASLGQRYGA